MGNGDGGAESLTLSRVYFHNDITRAHMRACCDGRGTGMAVVYVHVYREVERPWPRLVSSRFSVLHLGDGSLLVLQTLGPLRRVEMLSSLIYQTKKIEIGQLF